MTSSLGLPRYVLTFLRHMESHKDYLKWNISESGHKITLTLTWNFRRSKALSLSDNLLEKLQRTLNIGRAPERREESASVPQDLTKLLEATPKKHRKTRLKRRLSLTMGAIRRTLSTSSSQTPVRHNSINRSSSMGTLPHSTQHHYQSNHTSATSSLAKLPRHNSFHACSGGNVSRQLSPVTTTTFNESPARSAYSWGGGSFNISRGSTYNSQSADELDISGSQPLLDTATGSSCCSDHLVSPQKPRRLKLTYRSEDELEESLEDIMEKTRSETQAKLDMIRQEWNETMQEWPKIITAESRGETYTGYSNPPPSLSSTFIGNTSATGGCGSSSDTAQTLPPPPESPENLKQLQGMTIGKCLDSCDKILKRYETDIT